MTVENAQITSVSISMADHGILTFSIGVKGAGWGCCIGQFMNGVGHLGAKEWKGNGSAIVAMMKIMDTVGVEKWEDLKGKYIRVKSEGWGSPIYCIGNLIQDKWFDLKDFFSKDDGHAVYELNEGTSEEKEEEEDEDPYENEWHSPYDEADEPHF